MKGKRLWLYVPILLLGLLLTGCGGTDRLWLHISIQGEGTVYHRERGLWSLELRYWYYAMDRVELRAEPAEGFVFSHWVGDVDSPTERITFTVIRRWTHEILAVFREASLEDEEIHFPDPRLEQAVRARIQKAVGPIFVRDVSGIEKLAITNQSISQLEGLQYFSSLQELDVSENQVANLLPLQEIRTLEVLRLDMNQVTDVTPLSGLTNLHTLTLRRNQVADISALTHLTKLKTLLVEHNQVVSISALGSLLQLEFLNLSYNQISNIAPLVYRSWNPLAHIWIENNFLDLSAESETVEHILDLRARVQLVYLPQRTR